MSSAGVTEKRAGPSDPDSPIVRVPLVTPRYGRPQGEMLQALCVSLTPVFRVESRISRNPFGDVFSDLLTRKVSPFTLPDDNAK